MNQSQMLAGLLTLIAVSTVRAADFDIVDGTAHVSGKPNISQQVARDNWDAACEKWKSETKDLNKNDQVMMLSCENPVCSSNEGIITCSSNASFKVKTAGTRVQPQPALPPPQEPPPMADGTVIQTAPPPVIVEAAPEPRPGFIWIVGYWGWLGGRHYWYPGHWESHRPGYVYIGSRWVPHGHGWHYEPGHWRR